MGRLLKRVDRRFDEEILRRALAKKLRSKRALARAAGLSHSTLCNLLRGGVSVNAETAQRLCRALECDLSDLFTDELSSSSPDGSLANHDDELIRKLATVCADYADFVRSSDLVTRRKLVDTLYAVTVGNGNLPRGGRATDLLGQITASDPAQWWLVETLIERIEPVKKFGEAE